MILRLLTLCLLFEASSIFALEVQIRQDSPGSPLVAEILHQGALIIRNGLQQASQPVTVEGRANVNLGTPSKAGFYQFSFITAGALAQSKSITVFAESGRLYGSSGAKLVAVPDGAWAKFARNLTSVNAAVAWKRFNVGAWLASNSIELAKVETACLVWGAGTASGLGAAPAQVAAPVCYYGNASLGADLFLSVLEGLADHLGEQGTLTAAEHKQVVITLKTVSFSASIIADLASGDVLKGKSLGDAVQKAFIELVESSPAIAGKVVEMEAQNKSTKLTARLLGDETGKIIFILKLTK